MRQPGSAFTINMSALIFLLISSALLLFIKPTECTSTTEVKSSFVQQPKPVYYIVKSDVISLQCRAVHVAKMALKCNGEFVQVSKYVLTQDMENDTETITMNFTKRDLGAADASSMSNGASSALASSAKSADGGSTGGGGGGLGSPNGGGSGVNDYLECVCVAWSRSNNWYEFESDSSIIRQAYLKKFFPREPLPLEVELGNQAEFLCSPPEGQPTPQVYWTKNQKRLDEDDPRYHISNNGRTLLIHQVTMDDQGEYLCLAKNMASLRMSHKASLKVIVTGTWSPWSEWSECSSQCGRGIQQRHRDCHFTPLTPKQAAKAGHLQQQAVTSQSVNSGVNGVGKSGNNNVCKGEATQTADCTKMCPQDGGWSEWGTWHACGINCVKYRRRECNNPPPSHGGVPCLGTGLDRANCTGGECTRTGPGMYTPDGTPVLTGGNNGGSIGVNNNGNNGPIIRHDPAHISLKEVLLYVGLITIVAVFLAVAMAIVYLLHRRNKFYTGVLSIDERHHHYPTLSYTTDLPMSKCSGKTNGSLTNMIDMPYHISHSHLLRHPGQHGSLSTTPINPHAHYHNYHPHLMSAGGGASSCTGSHTSQQHLSTATTTTTINHHNNSLLSAASPTSGGGAGSGTGSNVSPPSYMSSDINSTQGLQRSLTPTYQYIEEHNQSSANSPTGPIADMIGAPGIAMMPIMTSGAMDLTHTASSLYSAHDPHYAHISESEFVQHNRQLNNNLSSSSNPPVQKSKRNSVHSRFSVDSGHFGDQASHNSSETNQGTGDDPSNPNQATGWRQHQPVYTCTSLLPSSIDPGSVAVGMVGYAGGRLSLPESGISLLIPEGAIAQGTTEELFLASSSDISENPRLLNTRDSILSATVFAGPPSVKFLKPVILSFDQSASRTEIDWTTSLYTQAPNADWKMCGDSGPSSKESTIHFEGKSCYVMSERLKFKYCLVGKATSSAVKQNQVVLFGGYLKSGSNYSVRVYMLNDNRDALARTMGDEMKMGGFLLNSPLKLPLKFDQGALSLTLNDLCPEWNNSAQSQIEIPLERLWNDTSGNFHLSFSFESSSTCEQSNMAVASIGPLSATLNITQGDQQHEIPFCIRPHEIPMCPLLCESATGGSGGNNWMYSNSSGRVFKLSPFTRARLSAALSESWTKLAKAIGLPKSVIDYLKRHAHPVDSVLDMWECRTHSEPQGVDLIKILTTIHRTDLVPLIEAEILSSSPTPPNCPSPTKQQQHASYAMAGGNLASSSDNNSCHLSSSC